MATLMRAKWDRANSPSTTAKLGGIESLAAGASAYYDNFYTETEKTATVQKQLAETLKAVGLAVPKNRDEFRALVEQQLRLGEAGAPAVAALFQVAGAFAQLNPVLGETAAVVGDASAVLEERNRLQEEYDSLVLTEAELLAKQQAAARERVDESNRLLFDQVQAARRAKEAQDAAKTSLGNFIGQMKSFASTASGLNDDLRLGSLSTLTPEQQYAEARRQFEQTKQLARAGDAAAQGRLQATEQTFLQLSQRLHGGDAQYSSDLSAVMSVNDELAQWAGAQVDVAQASLDALTDSSATLTDISTTLNAIARADRLTPVTVNGSQVANFSQAFSPIDYSRMGTLDMAPLAAEVKALREELKGVRNDLERQTGDKIKAGAEAAQRAAETVVDGVRDAVVDGAYADVNSRRGIK